ncbi:MAG TPA: chromate efflux transporter [Candidatus Binataceae bacterium]|nr:chromate efflux transporter [Candidatus Binataceae bacterium]
MKELAAPFLWLGLTAFGGPAAHIAMMEDQFVLRRRWLSREQFLDMLGATNLIPGPNSTEMAIHIGHQRRGWRGLVVAGVCFIGPAMMIVLAAAWAYVRFGSLPQVQGVLYAIKPVIIAIVFQALWRLTPTAVKNVLLGLIGLIGTLGAIWGLNTLLILFGSGALAAIGALRNRPPLDARNASVQAPAWLTFPAIAKRMVAAAIVVPFSMAGLFLFFLKVGAVLYGSGYVLLAFLQADLVDRLHWLTQSQLLDAVAVGQVTPGPVFTTATFIGYLLGGTRGALLATVAIFLPSFLFVAASRPLIPRIRRSVLAGAFLDGVNVGALALMAAVILQLGRAAVVDVTTGLVAALSVLALLYWRINSAWLILAAGVAGLAMSA